MTRFVQVVGPDTEFKTCARKLGAFQISALPVVDKNRRLVGIVSESDLLAKERQRGTKQPKFGIRWNGDVQAEGRTAGDVMTSPAICISPNASIPQAARLMYREAVKRLPVVDEKGVVVGIVSRADLLKAFTRDDEEIRREIVEDILKKALVIDPNQVKVEVVNGLVTLSGELETKSLIRVLVHMVGKVDGTVAVESKLTARLDDTRIRVEEPPQALHLAADDR